MKEAEQVAVILTLTLNNMYQLLSMHQENDKLLMALICLRTVLILSGTLRAPDFGQNVVENIQ